MMDKKGSLGGMPDEWLGEFKSDRWQSNYINDGISEIRNFLSTKNTILNASGVLIRNFSDLGELINDEMRFCADWLLWVRLLERGGIAYVARPLNYWRINSGNARNSGQGVLELAEGPTIINEAGRILKWKPEELERAVEKFKKRYLSTHE